MSTNQSIEKAVPRFRLKPLSHCTDTSYYTVFRWLFIATQKYYSHSCVYKKDINSEYQTCLIIERDKIITEPGTSNFYWNHYKQLEFLINTVLTYKFIFVYIWRLTNRIYNDLEWHILRHLRTYPSKVYVFQY